nr:MAG TPA: hypothetical protein [Caudoviricetes sp.]
MVIFHLFLRFFIHQGILSEQRNRDKNESCDGDTFWIFFPPSGRTCY